MFSCDCIVGAGVGGRLGVLEGSCTPDGMLNKTSISRGVQSAKWLVFEKKKSSKTCSLEAAAISEKSALNSNLKIYARYRKDIQEVFDVFALPFF